MGKSKKIDLKKVKIHRNEDKSLIVEGFEDEEMPFENLSDEVDGMIAEDKLFNIKIGYARKSSGGERAKQYKYHCVDCGKKIKSTEKELVVKCMDCNKEYIRE